MRGDCDWPKVPELLSCPFCGSADVEHNPGGNEDFVDCNTCGASGPEVCGDDAPEQAARRWNSALRHGTQEVRRDFMQVPTTMLQGGARDQLKQAIEAIRRDELRRLDESLRRLLGIPTPPPQS